MKLRSCAISRRRSRSRNWNALIPNGEVLIQVEAWGACHSDLHVADGDWPQLAVTVKRPLILGHEIAGHVVEGPAVHDLQIGDRVACPGFTGAAATGSRREGNENLCTRQKITGVTVDGASRICKGAGKSRIKNSGWSIRARKPPHFFDWAHRLSRLSGRDKR